MTIIKELLDDFFSVCPCCLDLPALTEVPCRNSHWVCQECISRLRGRCPLCRVQFMVERELSPILLEEDDFLNGLVGGPGWIDDREWGQRIARRHMEIKEEEEQRFRDALEAFEARVLVEATLNNRRRRGASEHRRLRRLREQEARDEDYRPTRRRL